jgi:aryl-alcohol dehydrogenase-like predicted oxidoreductase
MRYKLLGNSGLRVSELCLGTMTFGEEWGWGSSKDVSRQVYDAFREAGGNFIDTANVYTNGTSETYLGEFVRGQREQVVLATKYTNSAPTNDPNASGNQRKNMVQAVEASLKRLGTDYIEPTLTVCTTPAKLPGWSEIPDSPGRSAPCLAPTVTAM